MTALLITAALVVALIIGWLMGRSSIPVDPPPDVDDDPVRAVYRILDALEEADDE